MDTPAWGADGPLAGHPRSVEDLKQALETELRAHAETRGYLSRALVAAQRWYLAAEALPQPDPTPCWCGGEGGAVMVMVMSALARAARLLEQLATQDGPPALTTRLEIRVALVTLHCADTLLGLNPQLAHAATEQREDTHTPPPESRGPRPPTQPQ